MVYEIAEPPSTDKATGLTYVLVHFWPDAQSKARGEAPSLVNDFLMQLRPTARRVVTDAQGRLKKTDGSFIEPAAQQAGDEFERETVSRNLAAEIDANIQGYIQRATANKYSGDHTGDAAKPFFIDGVRQSQANVIRERDDSDPRGVLQHPDLVSLKEQIATRKAERVRR